MFNKSNVEKKHKGKSFKSTRPVVFLVVCSVLFMVIITVGTYLYFSFVVNKSESLLKNNKFVAYSGHYVLICDNSQMWTEVYSYAKEKADKDKILIDRIASRLSDDYSREDLMKIAIESGADGILIEAESTDTYRKLIYEADKKGICVVTLMNDCDDSKRKSLIQPSAYNIGKMYGEQFIKEKRREDKKVLVIMDASNKNTAQNIVFSGIQDSLKANGYSDIEVYPVMIDSSDSFATEEEIRKILMNEGKDANAIICLTEIATTGFYQALIDFNQVGNIRLIGYYNSDQIKKGIEQGVIEATIAVNTKEIAEYGVTAINEYREFGYVSDYYGVDSKLIDKSNINESIENEN